MIHLVQHTGLEMTFLWVKQGTEKGTKADSALLLKEDVGMFTKEYQDPAWGFTGPKLKSGMFAHILISI